MLVRQGGQEQADPGERRFELEHDRFALRSVQRGAGRVHVAQQEGQRVGAHRRRPRAEVVQRAHLAAQPNVASCGVERLGNTPRLGPRICK